MKVNNMKCNFISDPQLFNIIQTNEDQMLVLNLLRHNPFIDLGIQTINLHTNIDKLLKFNPTDINNEMDVKNFLSKNDFVQDKIEKLITNKEQKLSYQKRARKFICILSNNTAMARTYVKEFKYNIDEIFEPII